MSLHSLEQEWLNLKDNNLASVISIGGVVAEVQDSHAWHELCSPGVSRLSIEELMQLSWGFGL